MTPIQAPITGKETTDAGTSFAALATFYAAFNSGNMNLMADNWDNTDEVAMDNPLGGIKRGWQEISTVYEKLFNGPATVYVEFYDYTLHEKGDVFFAVGRERGFFELNGEKIELAIRTSRIFQRTNGLWKQVHHHGSITDPQLLERYQTAVLGR